MQCIHAIKIDADNYDDCLDWLRKNKIKEWRLKTSSEQGIMIYGGARVIYGPSSFIFRFHSREDAIAFKMAFGESILWHNII